MPAAIAAPQDIDYPGTITLKVDATDVARGIFGVEETIPVTGAGPLTLLYPEWLPGKHSASGPIRQLGGIEFYANGEQIPWRRDVRNVYAFHLDVPEGAATIEARYQFLSPTSTSQGRVVATPQMLNLQWDAVTLYPAGYYAARVPFSPSVTVPDGWTVSTALRPASVDGATTTFEEISLETMVDSPIFAGLYYRGIELNPGADRPVMLNMFADRPDQLEATEEQIAPHRELVRQATRLFGSEHYDHYDFLLAITDRMSGIGLEHHRSSENGVDDNYFTDWDQAIDERDLLGHEFTHSWNGKFRRPADLWVADYSVPMRDSLLWVYEGQTQYWGQVLTARSGLWSEEDALGSLAFTAAIYDARVGRTWRPLIDTTNDPIVSQRRPQAWRSWQRSEDYYSEGLLIWLDADTLIRERTRNRKSLDDFAQAFFGIYDGSYTPATYTFEDVVEALNGVMPYDWESFLNERLHAVGAPAPLDGLERGGYRLTYSEERSNYLRQREAQYKYADFLFSIGASIRGSGAVSEVIWDSPAFNAGLTNAAEIVAVNNEEYSASALRRAITAAKDSEEPITLLVKVDDYFRTLEIDYHDGLRYPRLERISGTPDRLGAILAPRRR